MSPLAFDTGDPRWCTYRQASERGWQVRKGERSTTGFFFKRIEVQDGAKLAGDEEATRRVPMLRSFALFHASQMENVPPFVSPTVAEAPWRAPEAAETIVANSGAVVRVGGDQAFYSPSTDHIQMPPGQSFHSDADWSSVMLHEMSHWSGAEARLNRDLRNSFGSHDYAREEMRVEIAMSFVCAELSIQWNASNSVSYIAFWLERLRSDRKEVFRAAADAQRIADYLLGYHPAYAASQDAAGACGGGDSGNDAAESVAPSAAPVAEAA